MIVSLLPSAGSMACSFNLEGWTLHCMPVSSIPKSIRNMRHRNEIVMAASIVSDVSGSRCPTKNCLTLNGLATNHDSQGVERPAFSDGAWLSKRLMLRGEVGAYQFFEINPRLDQIRVICYIVAPALKREMTEACRSKVLESS